MRIALHEVQRHLKKGLAPVYVLTGDEPLQLSEAADEIRAAARGAGYTAREVLEADSRFEWGRLTAEAQSLSLFSDRRIIDIRIPSGKPGAEGGRALDEYAGAPPQDTLLLLSLPKLERSQLSSKWFKALDRVGVVVQIWPVENERLIQWIGQRMRSRGVTPAPDVPAMLKERIEGNLLAAAQEIDKLLLIHGPGTVTTEQLAESVADSSRFDVFKLVDSALDGQTSRCTRIINGLRGEGTAPTLILWALTREIRLLAAIAWEVEKGSSFQQAVSAHRQIWDKRKPLVIKGVKRHGTKQWHSILHLCARADRAIKGQSRRDPWLLLEDIATRMSGAPQINAPDI